MKSLKAAGRRHELPAPHGDWTFSRRPGGWIVAERALPGGSKLRHLLALTVSGAKLWANGPWGALYGETSSGTGRAVTGPGAGDSDLVAQFPGKVRKVLVRQGDRVAEGDRLVLIEAMKMEFAVKAPYAGRVGAVHVRDGQQLAPGDRFVDLAAEGGDES